MTIPPSAQSGTLLALDSLAWQVIGDHPMLRFCFAACLALACSVALGQPIHDMARRGDTELLRLVFRNNPLADANGVGWPPLYYAATGDVARLLIEAGADPSARDNAGNTPLHNAATGDVARLLIEAGANPNARGSAGDTPLHNAAGGKGREEVVRMLLVLGADPNARNAYGETPLDYAVLRKDFNVASAIRASGGELGKVLDRAEKTGDSTD